MPSLGAIAANCDTVIIVSHHGGTGIMNADQFTAEGWPWAGSAVPGAAFSNLNVAGHPFDWGMNVWASRCGVLGQVDLDATWRQMYEITSGAYKVGVQGQSGDYGVIGYGGQVGAHGRVIHPSGSGDIAGVGVWGQAEMENETGVKGENKGGVGVYGLSHGGPGGMFISQAAAQLRLTPIIRGLPPGGKVGDVAVINVAKKDQDQAIAEMWLCTEISKKGRPVWRQVQLGAPQEN